MVSVEEYKLQFKKELERGKTLDELFQSIAERMVVRDMQIRSEKQALLLDQEVIKILEERCER